MDSGVGKERNKAMTNVKTIIGLVLFILGIMCADSECLLVPMALLLIGGYMAKDMVGSDE